MKLIKKLQTRLEIKASLFDRQNIVLRAAEKAIENVLIDYDVFAKSYEGDIAKLRKTVSISRRDNSRLEERVGFDITLTITERDDLDEAKDK